MAKGIHLFPFRTEKLSPLAPMVLPTGGRVGRCRIQMERVTVMWLSLFLSYLSCLVLSYLISSCVLCTCSVFFFVLWCGCFSLSFLCFLLYSLLHSLLIAFSVALFLRYSIFSFVLFVPFQPCCASLLFACLACFCLPDFSFSLFIFFFCACTCVCWIRFGYLLLNLFCFDIKL